MANSSHESFIPKEMWLSNELLSRGGKCQWTFEIVSLEILWWMWRSYQTIWNPLLRMLLDMLWHDQCSAPSIDQTWHLLVPLLPKWTLLATLTFVPIPRSVQRTCVTSVACQQRRRVPQGTWYYPTWDLHQLACRLMLRQSLLNLS